MIVRLDHLCEIISRSFKDASFFPYPVPSLNDSLQGLVIESDLAVQIVIGIDNMVRYG